MSAGVGTEITADIASQPRPQLIFRARLAEQADRYDEMARFMRAAIELDSNLSLDDRHLFSVAYKNCAGERRSSSKVLQSLEGKQRSRGENELADAAALYRQTVDKELRGICDEVVHLINDVLLPAVSSDDIDAKVFYYKMVGDYHRYTAEIFSGEEKLAAKSAGLAAYRQGIEIAKILPPCSSTRLGLHLNYSVFCFDILASREEACAVAKAAFEDAVASLDSATEESYRDAAMIMQLLRDNLQEWQGDNGKENPPMGKPQMPSTDTNNPLTNGTATTTAVAH